MNESEKLDERSKELSAIENTKTMNERDKTGERAKVRTIIENLRTIRRLIAQGDDGLADDIQTEAINAIRFGMEYDDPNKITPWRKLMLRYAPEGSDQLERLCGNDPIFMAGDWGMECLAYIAGNSTCGIETATMTGTERGFNTNRVLYVKLNERETDPLSDHDLYNVLTCEELRREV